MSDDSTEDTEDVIFSWQSDSAPLPSPVSLDDKLEVMDMETGEVLIVPANTDHAYSQLWDNHHRQIVLPYLHSSTYVHTPNGARCVTGLHDGDNLLDREGRIVSLEKIFKIQPKSEFIRFGTGSLQCKEPNKEPTSDLYVSPSVWFLYKHSKAMDCENIISGNSISRTKIDFAADVYLLCTEKGNYIRTSGIEIATIPIADFMTWLASIDGGRGMPIVQRSSSVRDTWIRQ